MSKLGIRLENGTWAEAPLQEWFAALLATMTPEQRVSVVEQLTRNRGAWKDGTSPIARPPKGYVLHAEPGVIFGRMG